MEKWVENSGGAGGAGGAAAGTPMQHTTQMSCRFP